MGHAGLVVVTYGRCLLVDSDRRRGKKGEGRVRLVKGLLVFFVGEKVKFFFKEGDERRNSCIFP